MASAGNLDQWHDPEWETDMETLQGWSLSRLMLRQNKHIQSSLQWLDRYSQIPGGRVEWASKAHGSLYHKATWMAGRCSIPVILPEEAKASMVTDPDLSRELTLRAQTLDPVDFVLVLHNETSLRLTELVNFGRARIKEGIATRAERSLGNKFGTCLVNQLSMMNTWFTQLQGGVAGRRKIMEEGLETWG
jgi:hypothetical protein